MQQAKKQAKSKESQINAGQSLCLIHQIQRQKNLTYPYYAVGDTYSDHQKGIDFLIIVQLNRQSNPMLYIYPFTYKSSKGNKSYTKIPYVQILLQGLPERAASIIKVQKMEYSINSTTHSTNAKIDKLDFVVGYRAGYLLNVRYINKEIKVLSRMNRLKNKQGFMSKATNYIFPDGEFYKTWAKGHVMKIIQHYTFKNHQKNLKPCYSYQIGKFIYILPQMSEQLEQGLHELYEDTNWSDPHFTQKSNSNIFHIKTSHYKGIRSKSSVLIQFQNSPSCYQLSTTDSFLFVARDSTILTIDLKTMLIVQLYSFQLAIRSISLAKSTEDNSIQYLSVMPYEDILYIFELKNQRLVRYCKLIGNRAFIMQTIVDKGCIIAAGADHRICITPIHKIQVWEYVCNQKIDFFNSQQIKKHAKHEKCQKISRNQIPSVKKLQKMDRVIQINENIESNKFQDIYSLGVYNNARNNSYEYGFGDAVKIGDMYCFFNLDGKIKIFEI